MNKKTIIDSIPASDTDKLLSERGYNLLDEYIEMIYALDLKPEETIFDFATGTGRMTSLLTRFNLNVITADLSDEDREKAITRITENYISKVKFILLNLESLPFNNNSLLNIETVNTIHHLDNPRKCIKELIRVHSSSGILLIADFNQKGFDVMDEVHLHKYGEPHTRGNFSWEETKEIIKSSYKNVDEIETTLNHALIASNKKKDV